MEPFGWEPNLALSTTPGPPTFHLTSSSRILVDEQSRVKPLTNSRQMVKKGFGLALKTGESPYALPTNSVTKAGRVCPMG